MLLVQFVPGDIGSEHLSHAGIVRCVIQSHREHATCRLGRDVAVVASTHTSATLTQRTRTKKPSRHWKAYSTEKLVTWKAITLNSGNALRMK